MIAWAKARVVEICQETEQIQIVKIEQKKQESKAVHYLYFGRQLKLNDIVIVNQTANKLHLGTGGYDFVVSVCDIEEEGEDEWNSEGHIMKLRYTPYQFPILSVEEQSSPYHDVFTEQKFLDGMPVVIGELHSMLPTFITILRQLEAFDQLIPRKIVYIMTDGGSLPISLSGHVRLLKMKKWLDYTITIGHSFGGDLEAVNIYTALLAAKHIFNADLVVVIMGPGIVGTGTLLGHTGVEQGEIINAVNTLKGNPISIIRSSGTDKRSRHCGISHHSITALQLISLTTSDVPYPNWLQLKYPDQFYILNEKIAAKHSLKPTEVNLEKVMQMLEKYPEPIKTMSRQVKKDELFLGFVASSALYVHYNFQKKNN